MTTEKNSTTTLSQTRLTYALLLIIFVVGAGLRFWQLGHLPPGLYRDEAYNGLDALGILNGEHALFFTANNGREPAYIYLSALFVVLFGRTALGIRAAAAVIGSLTTLVVFGLTKSWFGRTTALFGAWLWAVTVWPIHLSRIGLRAIVAVPITALAVWFATRAYKENSDRLWIVTGIFLGLGFYTYLTARLLPAVFVSVIVVLAIQQKAVPWRGALLTLAGWVGTLLPMFVLWAINPELLGGRSSQVSILNPAINQGNLVGTFLNHVWQALNLFFIEGDSIARHNPPGRPLFDPLMAVPFVLGLIWLGREWRKTATVTLAAWVAVMLAATILAEDAPHFLRASGILPAALLPAAIGLAWGWELPSWRWLGRGVVVLIMGGSLVLTIHDYFLAYPVQLETEIMFEAAARDLAEQINAESGNIPIFVDQRYQDNWPSLLFLLDPGRELIRLDHNNLIPNWFTGPFVYYVWPLDGLDLGAMTEGTLTQTDTPILISTETGPLTRGDLEGALYPLYTRFRVLEITPDGATVATLGTAEAELYTLHSASLTPQEKQLTVDLVWSPLTSTESRNDKVFVHLIDRESGQVVAQSDSAPGQGYWATHNWRPNMQIHDQHKIMLSQPWDESRFLVVVGMYPADNPQNRLQIWEPNGQTGGNTVEIR